MKRKYSVPDHNVYEDGNALKPSMGVGESFYISKCVATEYSMPCSGNITRKLMQMSEAMVAAKTYSQKTLAVGVASINPEIVLE